MSTASARTPAEFEERLARYLFERSEEARAVRVGEKEVSEQAEIVARYPDLFTRRAARGAARRRGRGPGRGARAALPPAQDLRGRHRRGRARRARGRARERTARRADRVARRGDAAAHRAGEAGRPAGVRRPRGARRAARRGHRAGSTTTASSCSPPSEELAAELSGEPDPVARNEEEKGDLAARARGRARGRDATRRPPPGSRCASAGSTACSATIARSCRARPTRPGCGGSRRSRRRTAKERCGRSAWRRCGARLRPRPRHRTSGSTSTTGRRSRRARA